MLWRKCSSARWVLAVVLLLLAATGRYLLWPGLSPREVLGQVRSTARAVLYWMKPSDALRIMPLGDSITLGALSSWDRGNGGYREPLWRKLRSAGLQVDFVGSQRDGPPEIDRDHEGHGGWRIDQLAERLDFWLAAFRPDIILLHVGHNDLIQGATSAVAAERLARLADRISARRPQTRVLVATLVGVRNENDFGLQPERILDFNDYVRNIDEDGRDRAGVFLVDMHEHAALGPGELGPDGVHPNSEGYRRMAQVWFRYLVPTLRSIRHES